MGEDFLAAGGLPLQGTVRGGGFLGGEAKPMPEHLTSEACDEYMASREGCYEWRAVRYRAAADFMTTVGLTSGDSLCDVGAGWTELDYCLRTEYKWRGRYLPLDAGLMPLDLEEWTPHRKFEHFVALELLEHLKDPGRLLESLMEAATKTVVVTVPNPETVDVRAMDSTHVSEPDRTFLEGFGLTVTDSLFYGGVYSGGLPDALLGTYKVTK